MCCGPDRHAGIELWDKRKQDGLECATYLSGELRRRPRAGVQQVKNANYFLYAYDWVEF